MYIAARPRTRIRSWQSAATKKRALPDREGQNEWREPQERIGDTAFQPRKQRRNERNPEASTLVSEINWFRLEALLFLFFRQPDEEYAS